MLLLLSLLACRATDPDSEKTDRGLDSAGLPDSDSTVESVAPSDSEDLALLFGALVGARLQGRRHDRL